MPRRRRDEYEPEENGYEESPSGESLCDMWRTFVDEELDTFNLVPSDYHGALSEAYLDAFIRNGPQSIESEARVAFAESLYQKYSELIGDFMESVGKKGIDPRAEAESCGGNYFWDTFVLTADRRASRNVWDLFKYNVVVIRRPTFPLQYERFRAKSGRIVYRVMKDSNYIRFTSFLAGYGFKPEDFDRLPRAEYESEGVGFVGGYVRAEQIVKRISEGMSYITVDNPIAGIFDWETSAGAIIKLHERKIDIPFSDMIVETDGVVRDAYERRRVRV